MRAYWLDCSCLGDCFADGWVVPGDCLQVGSAAEILAHPCFEAVLVALAGLYLAVVAEIPALPDFAVVAEIPALPDFEEVFVVAYFHPVDLGLFRYPFFFGWFFQDSSNLPYHIYVSGFNFNRLFANYFHCFQFFWPNTLSVEGLYLFNTFNR